jgi:hypothetical protein
MVRIIAVAGLLLAIASPASAQNCKKGIPCGNSCIAAGRTCRVGAGTATAAPGSPGAPLPPTTAPNVPASAGIIVPAGMTFVAALGGRVFYTTDRSCTVWREMPPNTLLWFKDASAARGAGLIRSSVTSC